ncbi:VWA domain-containing protein [Natronoglycomyces albus]|uniref:VWA domain-containing protein n=1 Tax=Natronoglycomyces albus TaxID=2811108 RepID=A0A895XLT4_9ACTN|nr:VWA domain-containing protein [Natronoglycomyces albus]QSB06651.1 VWA domain-containing protein [Natronoglycomyces albus]
MIRLLEPVWLLTLLPVLALVGMYIVAQQRRRGAAVRFANTALLSQLVPKTAPWRRHVPPALLAVALMVVSIGLAKPALDTEEPNERATIIIALDVSLSMMADDVEPTRLEAAQVAAADFVADLPEEYNVGLVSYAGHASVTVSPTRDHSQVITAINGLQLAEATAIGEAIYASLNAIQQAPPDESGELPPSHILLMSDGAQTVGRDWAEAALVAAEARVPVSTVSFGTEMGAIDLDGQMVPVPPDLETLGEIANMTGGSAYAAASMEELRSVYEDMGSSVGYQTVVQEIWRWFMAIAGLLVMGAVSLGLLWGSRIT